MARGGRYDGDDEERVTFPELVRRVIAIERNYVSKGEFGMLVAGLTVAATGLIALLVTAINIRSAH